MTAKSLPQTEHYLEMENHMIICKAQDLNKTYYDDSREINSIINCNIEIKEGECVVICGDKDAGKSTLLHILGGFERPTSGSVYIDQKDITAYSDDELAIMRRREIGFLLQNDSLIPELNVHENIIMPAILAHTKYNDAYYHSLINSLRIKDILYLYPKQLHADQLQCVMYARSLINNPKIILMDETSGNTDLNRKIMDFLFNVVYLYHKTLIMVNSDGLDQMSVNHIIRLKNGEVIENRLIS